MHNLSQSTNTIILSGPISAGTSNITTLPSVDMQNYTGLLLIAVLGTLTATQVTALHAQQSSDNGGSDAFADLAGTGTGPAADADSTKALVLDVTRPAKRYIKPIITRATANAAIASVIAVQYNGANMPATLDSSISDQNVVVTPAAGTP